MQVLDGVNTSQVSTNTNTLVSSSIMDSESALSVSYTLGNTGDDSVDYEIIAGNLADLSDGVVLDSGTILSGGFATYAVSIAPYGFYGVNVQSSVNDTPGTISVIGRAKG